MANGITIDRGTPSNNPSLLLLRSKGYDVRVNCYRQKREYMNSASAAPMARAA